MRVRFEPPKRTEAAREDGLLMPLAPARRPRRPYWQWYLLVTAAAIPVLAGLVWLLREFSCVN